MKKILCLFLASILCVSLVACGSDSHAGEAKTPSGSSSMEGRNYEEVVVIFEEKGFTNIKTEPIEDLIFGWLTKDGEVEEVSVGGDVDYAPDKWVPADTEVIIRYHTFPADDAEETKPTEAVEETETPTVETNPPETTPPETTEPAEEILTIENCPDLTTLLSLKDPFDPFVKEFASKYKGCIIEFDGNIAFMSNHDGYKTRYDILIYAGDYSETSASGPSFQFNDVNMFDLNLIGDNIPDYIGTGNNLHIVAEVGKYNENSGLFELDPISTEVR